MNQHNKPEESEKNLSDPRITKEFESQFKQKTLAHGGTFKATSHWKPLIPTPGAREHSTRTQEQIETYWGVLDPQSTQEQFCRLTTMGIIPGVLFPLAEAAKGWSGNRAPYKGPKFARKIISRLSENSQALLARQHGKKTEVVKGEIIVSQLFTKTCRGYPDIELANDIKQATIEFICDKFGDLDETTVASTINDPRHKNPTDVVLALWELKPHIIDEVNTHNLIDPYLLGTDKSGALENDSETLSENLHPNYKGIITRLKNQQHRLIILYGQSFGGKTQVMKAVIADLLSRDNMEINPSAYPIFAGQCKEEPFSKILHDVFKFWMADQYRVSALSSIDDQTKWKIVKRAALKPAIYIFNCVVVAERDQPRSFFAGRNFVDLVEMLREQNPDTVIIIAGSKIRYSEDPSVSTLKYFAHERTIKISALAATLKSCAQMLPTLESPDRYLSKTFSKLIKNRGGQDGNNIPAAAMIAFCSLVDLEQQIDDNIARALISLSEHADLSNVSGKSKDDFFAPLWKKYLGIAGQWHGATTTDKQHFQRLLKLLTASEDAVYVSSLKIMLDEWQDAYPLRIKDEAGTEMDVNVPSENRISAFVTHWSGKTRNKLVCCSDQATLKENEKLPCDYIYPSFSRNNIRMDPPIRKELELQFKNKSRTDLLICRRLLARMARRRGNQIRLSSPFPFATRISDINRDIQTCLELLASVDTEATSTKASPAASSKQEVNHECDNAFDLKNLSNSKDVIRYVYRQIFKNEIDHGARLSMILGNDRMRLFILGSLLHGLGDRYDVCDRREATDLPSKQEWRTCLSTGLSAEVCESLSPKEQVELLQAMGISAFYFNQKDILIHAYQSAKKIEKETRKEIKTANLQDLDDLLEAVDRLKCFCIDFDVLRHNSSVESDKQNLNDHLKELEYRLEEIRHSNRETDENTSIGRTYNSDLIREKTRQRLLERQLQIYRLQHNQADKEKTTIKNIEICHKYLVKYSNNLSGGFGGRLCRSLFFSILGNLALDSKNRWQKLGWNREEVVEKLDRYLKLATSRLAIYSGAERASTLAMHALREALVKNYGEANHYAKQAAEVAEFSNVSHGVRVQITWINCQVKYLTLKTLGLSEVNRSEVEQLKKEIGYLRTAALSGQFHRHAEFAAQLLGKFDNAFKTHLAAVNS